MVKPLYVLHITIYFLISCRFMKRGRYDYSSEEVKKYILLYRENIIDY